MWVFWGVTGGEEAFFLLAGQIFYVHLLGYVFHDSERYFQNTIHVSIFVERVQALLQPPFVQIEM